MSELLGLKQRIKDTTTADHSLQFGLDADSDLGYTLDGVFHKLFYVPTLTVDHLNFTETVRPVSDFEERILIKKSGSRLYLSDLDKWFVKVGDTNSCTFYDVVPNVDKYTVYMVDYDDVEFKLTLSEKKIPSGNLVDELPTDILDADHVDYEVYLFVPDATHPIGWYEVADVADHTAVPDPGPDYQWVEANRGGIRQVDTYEDPTEEHELIQWIADDDEDHGLRKDGIYCAEENTSGDLEWQLMITAAEPIKDVTLGCGLAATVSGYVKRLGNLVIFSLKKSSSVPINVIAETMPEPYSITDFVASCSSTTSSSSDIVTITSSGSLEFSDPEGHSSFVVEGSYFSKEYPSPIGMAYLNGQTFQIEDVRDRASELIPENVGNRYYQNRDIEEGTPGDPGYYFAPKGWYEATDNGDLAVPRYTWEKVEEGEKIEVEDISEYSDLLVSANKGYRLYQYKSQGCPPFATNKGIYWLNGSSWSLPGDVTCYGIRVSTTSSYPQSILCGELAAPTQDQLNVYIQKAVEKAAEMGIPYDISDSILFYSVDDLTIDRNYGLEGVDPDYKSVDAGWVRYVHNHGGPFQPYEIDNLTLSQIEADLASAYINQYSSFTPGTVVTNSTSVRLLDGVLADPGRDHKVAILAYEDMDINSDLKPAAEKGWFEVVESTVTPGTYEWSRVQESGGEGIRQIDTYEAPSTEHELVQWISSDDVAHDLRKDGIYAAVKQSDDSLKWVRQMTLAEKVQDIKSSCDVEDDIVGFVERHGNLVNFQFSYKEDTDITLIASSMPTPVHEYTFVGTNSSTASSNTVIATLNTSGVIELENETNEFVIQGSYFSTDFRDALGWDVTDPVTEDITTSVTFEPNADGSVFKSGKTVHVMLELSGMAAQNELASGLPIPCAEVHTFAQYVKGQAGTMVPVKITTTGDVVFDSSLEYNKCYLDCTYLSL